MKTILLAALLIIAIVMIVMGINAKMAPPALTGVGFIVIAVLLYQKKN